MEFVVFFYKKQLFFVLFLVSRECEEFKKQYSKVLDAYGCLGVLQLYGGLTNESLLYNFLIPIF